MKNWKILIALWQICCLLVTAEPFDMTESNFVHNNKLVFAHRGASGYIPEHTLPAIALAYQMGADFLEQDVVLTKDCVPIVLHDIHLETVTDVAKVFPDRHREDGRYYALDFTLAEIKLLEVHERTQVGSFEPVYPGRLVSPHSLGLKVPTLAEELAFIQGLEKTLGRPVGVCPEIKHPRFHREAGADISVVTLQVLEDFGYNRVGSRCLLQCFDFREVKRIREKLGYEGALLQLMAPNEHQESPTDYRWLGSEEGLKKLSQYADFIGPWGLMLVPGKGYEYAYDEGLLERARRLGFKVVPYTFRADELPPGIATLEQLLHLFFTELGVDGVFSDHPDKVVRYLGR